MLVEHNLKKKFNQIKFSPDSSDKVRYPYKTAYFDVHGLSHDIMKYMY